MELKNRHKMILEALDNMRDWASRTKGEDGYLPKSYFAREFEPELAHLLERGFIKFGESNRFTGAYVITSSGLAELVRMGEPDYEVRELRKKRTALETQLVAVNARLAALEPKAERGGMTEAGITRLIGDSLQNGE